MVQSQTIVIAQNIIGVLDETLDNFETLKRVMYTENDDIIKNIDQKRVGIAEFDLKNVEILIENNLLENKLIKPLYLS